MKKVVEAVLRAVGPASLGAIALAVWGLFGWQWALIVAAAPVAVFYLWGEVLVLRSWGRRGAVE